MNNTPPGIGTCQCARCYDGKPHLPVDEAKIEAALTRAGYPKPPRRANLRVLTMPTETEGLQCDGTMTCPCERCAHERGRIQPRHVRQPWDAIVAA